MPKKVRKKKVEVKEETKTKNPGNRPLHSVVRTPEAYYGSYKLDEQVKYAKIITGVKKEGE